MAGRLRARAAKTIGWAASKTGSRAARNNLLALQARIGQGKQTQQRTNGARPKETVNRLVARLKIATESQGLAEKSLYGIGGFGLGSIAAGNITAGTLIAGLGLTGRFSFARLEKNSQKKLVAALLGRPRLAEAVCGRMINPRLETQLQCLGKIFLPRKELVKLRKTVLNSKNFDFGKFWFSVKPLISLGAHFETNPRLTSTAVKTCLEAYKTRLEFPLQQKTRKAVILAIDSIELIENKLLRFRTLKSIIQQVFAAPIPEEAKKDTALHLGRRMLASQAKTIIESDSLADLGWIITATRQPDENIKIEFKRAR